MRTFADIIDTILDCDTVTDIGQIGNKDLSMLNKAVKAGAISKGKGGEYPAIKTVYAPKGFDFVRHRQAVIDLLKDAESGKISKMDYITYKWNYQQFITN